jgi:hypothetical protein
MYLKAYISSLVLWRRPVQTLYYATHELIHLLIRLTKWSVNKGLIALTIKSNQGLISFYYQNFTQLYNKH